MRSLALIPGSLCAALLLAAQTPSPGTFKISKGSLDLSIPESPAFTVLGLTPETVVRPTTPRELATSLVNGVDRNGNFQTGVAIDTAPYMLLAGNTLTIGRYRAQKMSVTRFVARTQVSFAITKGASEADKSARMALGFRFTLFDNGDPRLDGVLLQCLADAQQKALSGDPIPPNATEEQQAAILRKREESVKAIAKTCRADAQKRNWNNSSWIIGAAPSWTSSDGTTRNMKASGYALWSSIGCGFETVPVLKDTSQLIGHFRYRTKEQVPDPQAAGKFLSQDSTAAGARLRAGTGTTTANFEGVFFHAKPGGRKPEEYWRISFGAERKISDNLWLVLTFGRETGRKDNNDKVFILTSFNWGFAQNE